MDSLARIISYAFCWDTSWKINEIFYLNQSIPEIEIFRDKKCLVTFGFEYTLHALWYVYSLQTQEKRIDSYYLKGQL